MDIELLLKELDKLTLQELIALYWEAKTGETGTIEEMFRPKTVELINNLSEAIKLPGYLNK